MFAFRLLSIVMALPALIAGTPGLGRTADPFRETVQPFVKQYCVQCHNPKKKSAELDLQQYDSAEKLQLDYRQWEHVSTFVSKSEMPPAKNPQPTPDQRTKFLAAIESLLRDEAHRTAGDPGPVPIRRLSRAEYEATIHDLTDVPIEAAKSFPIDPASGEGFNNTGEALVLTPALFKKYYGAAEWVAEHALLSPTGLRFAPHPVVAFADRQKYCEQNILRFYADHAVDYEKYFLLLWNHQRIRTRGEAVPIERLAAERKLSPVFAELLRSAVEDRDGDRFLLRRLRESWAKVPADDEAKARAAIRTLAAEMTRLGRSLTPVETPAIVANAGNGPIDHLARRRQTAAERDQFDSSGHSGRKIRKEYGGIAPNGSVRLVIQVDRITGSGGGAGDGDGNGPVLIKGELSASNPAEDGRQKWSLREVIEKVSPETARRLTFGKRPGEPDQKLGADVLALGVAEALDLTIGAESFGFRAKTNLTLTLDVQADPAGKTAAMVIVKDRPDAADSAMLNRPIISPGHSAANEYARSAAAFCRLFPNRFYFVDDTRGLSAGFHLIEGFHRDDRPLCRSVLTAEENLELDRLWRELEFVTGIWERLIRGFVFFERSERNFMKHPDFDEFKETDPALINDAVLARLQEVYLKRSNVKLTGSALDAHPISVFFNSVRRGLRQDRETSEQRRSDYLRSTIEFAERAYRRPLTPADRSALQKSFDAIADNPDHGLKDAVRATLTRILVSPDFLLIAPAVPAGTAAVPLADRDLAVRLSYFITGGPPDAELAKRAIEGKLQDPRILAEQTQRLLKDPKVERFCREFFGQWLGYREFLTQESVDRRAFPAFDESLKRAMFEEPTRFAADLIRTDRPLTEILNGDSTWVNGKLARHYGLPHAGPDDQWAKVNGLHAQGRAGYLGMAVFLTKNSQPQRTSPVKRGFWVVHKLLGEHIPPPPPDVAVLPAKETETNGKTVRQLLKLHVEDARCARCHERFDPIGLSLEGFDPIGKRRTRDLGGRTIDDVVSLPDGKSVRGAAEFADYLAARRSGEFADTLCRKLAGYALGRSLQLSDKPLLEALQKTWSADGARPAKLFETIVLSPQFRNIRGRSFDPAAFRARPPGGKSE